MHMKVSAEQFVVEGLRDSSVNALKLLLIAFILFYKNPELDKGDQE